ncbi:MAG: ABC transporter substrate-binding protein [Rhodospirillaceae bacterium]
MSVRTLFSRTVVWIVMVLSVVPQIAAHAETTLRVGITSFSTSRGNPFNTTSGLPPLYTYAAFFEGLTRVNNDAETVPMLAERWEPESETTWLFYLRPGAQFSNGEPVDAAAVAATYAIMETDLGKTYPVTRELAGIIAVDVVDEATVRVATSAPDILLPHKIAALKIVPPRYWADVRSRTHRVWAIHDYGVYAVTHEAGSVSNGMAATNHR